MINYLSGLAFAVIGILCLYSLIYIDADDDDKNELNKKINKH